MFIAYFPIQVSRIAAAFNLQPPVYLIKEFDNNVIFPSENSGKFNPAALSTGSTYEVQGNDKSQIQSAPTYTTSSSPFGAYPAVTPYLTNPNRIPSVPTCTSRTPRKLIKKNIQVASLSSRDPDKPTTSSRSNRFTHTVVTQVIVTLDPSHGECNVSYVAEAVKKQLGFNVILLDSKLLPVVDSESTSGMNFWKSTRKIIAVSRTAYEKVGGVVPDVKLNLEDDVEIIEPQVKKAKRSVSVSDNVAVILNKLDDIDGKFSFIVDIQKAFECIICRSPVKHPVIAPCCQRIVGCKDCVARWVLSNTRCPLCAISGRMGEIMELKGIDDLTGFFRASDRPINSSPPVSQDGETNAESDSADDFELPNISVRREPRST